MAHGMVSSPRVEPRHTAAKEMRRIMRGNGRAETPHRSFERDLYLQKIGTDWMPHAIDF